jgi:hypothetical protein
MLSDTGTPVAAAERTSELAGDTEISAIRAEIPLGPGHRSQRAVTDFSSGESCSEGWQRLLLQNGERKSARHCLDCKTAEHRKPGMVFVSAN